jgi:hypothetical protein
MKQIERRILGLDGPFRDIRWVDGDLIVTATDAPNSGRCVGSVTVVYHDCPRWVFRGLAKADNTAAYFNRKVVGKYPVTYPGVKLA